MRSRITLPIVAACVVSTALALGSVTPTVSALTDRASLNLGPAGIGSEVPFSLVSIHPDGSVHHAPPGSGAVVPLTGDDAFVPGRSISVDLGVANNTPGIAAAVTMTIVPAGAGGTGQVGTAPNITPFIRVTVVDAATGELLVGGSAADPAQGASIADANAVLGRLTPRGAAPLADGAAWVAGDPESRRNLTITLHYADSPEASEYNGGRSALEVVFHGTSAP